MRGHHRNHCSHYLLLASLLASGIGVSAASLGSATVTETRNEVTLSKQTGEKRRAEVKDVLAGKDLLTTGRKSRAELLFNDNTIARVGANAIFSFDPPTREMTIDRGSALIHVPPGLSGAKIRSPMVTVAILGDVVAMRVDERGATQIVALSQDERGPVTVTLNKTGEKRTLKSGEMLIIDPADVKIPDVSVVSVEVFAQSSGLVNGFGTPLPESAQKEIQTAEAVQTKEIKNGSLEGAGEPQPDAEGLPMADPALIQAAIGHTVAGRYTGLARDLLPSPGTENMVLDINGDGSFSGTLTDTVSFFVTTFSGISSNNGSFTGTNSDGDAVQGTISLGGGNASGSYQTSSGISGVFDVNR